MARSLHAGVSRCVALYAQHSVRRAPAVRETNVFDTLARYLAAPAVFLSGVPLDGVVADDSPADDALAALDARQQQQHGLEGEEDDSSSDSSGALDDVSNHSSNSTNLESASNTKNNTWV